MSGYNKRPTGGSSVQGLQEGDNVSSLSNDLGYNICYPAVISRLGTPPESPSTGDRYLIIAPNTGAWADTQLNHIAEWNGTFWYFTGCDLGATVFVTDENSLYYINPSSGEWEVSYTIEAGAGADQSPWTGDIDADGNALENVGGVSDQVQVSVSGYKSGLSDFTVIASPDSGTFPSDVCTSKTNSGMIYERYFFVPNLFSSSVSIYTEYEGVVSLIQTLTVGNGSLQPVRVRFSNDKLYVLTNSGMLHVYYYDSMGMYTGEYWVEKTSYQTNAGLATGFCVVAGSWPNPSYVYVTGMGDPTNAVFAFSYDDDTIFTALGSAAVKFPNDVIAEGDYIFVASEPPQNQDPFNGVVCFDISAHTDPVFVSQVSTDTTSAMSGPTRLCKAGNYIYTANIDDNTLTTIDATDFEDMSLVNTINNITFANAVVADTVNNLLYVTASGDGRLRVFSIANPATPTLISTKTGLAGPFGVDFYDDVVCVADYSGNKAYFYDKTLAKQTENLAEWRTFSDDENPAAAIESDGSVNTAGYKVGANIGQTQTITIVTDIRMNTGQMEKKTISVTYTKGIITSVGVESDWTTTTDI